MDQQKLSSRLFHYPNKKSDPVSRPRRFSLDSLKLIPIDKTPQAWTLTQRKKSLEEKEQTAENASKFAAFKYRTLPAIGNNESSEMEDSESNPIFTPGKRNGKNSKLVRANTYEVIQPIVVDEIEEKRATSSTIPSDEIVLIICLPDGARVYGYFKYSDRIIDLLQFCQRQSGECYKNCSVVIKNKVVSELDKTFSELNLTNENKVLLVRKI